MIAEKKGLLAKPYTDRRLILFIDDEVVEAHERAEKAVAESRKYIFGADSYLEYFKPRLQYLSIDDLSRILAIVRSYFLAKRDGLDIKIVGKSLISNFQLPPGHPRDNVVYIGHPAVPQWYMPLSDFHRAVFEHKFSEAMSMLMNLGAKSIRVKYIKGWGLEFLLNLDTVAFFLPSKAQEEVAAGSLPDICEKQVSSPEKMTTLSPQEKARGEELRGNVEQVVLLRTSAKNEEVPRLPANLVWYQYEPTWQWVGEGRINFSLKEFILDVSCREDFDINLSLKNKLDRAGFNVGGEFERHIPTMWRLFGEFWD